jgi:hypothetical protein
MNAPGSFAKFHDVKFPAGKAHPTSTFLSVYPVRAIPLPLGYREITFDAFFA